MTKKDFLILMIKLFGLYLGISVLFAYLPGNLAYLATGDDDGVVAITSLLVAALTVGLFYLLTFTADRLVNFLKLDKGFADDRIELANLHTDDLVGAGVFIIGGLVFVGGVPRLLSDLLWSFKAIGNGEVIDKPAKVEITISFLKTLVGFLLVTNHGLVAKYFGKKRNKE